MLNVLFNRLVGLIGDTPGQRKFLRPEVNRVNFSNNISVYKCKQIEGK